MNKVVASLTALTATIAALGFSAPAKALTFGTSGIKFDTNTVVTFNFVESHGAFQSGLHIFESGNLNKSLNKLFWETKSSDHGGANEWKGTFGNTVTSANGSKTQSFLFKAGHSYTLGLLSGGNGTVYSTNALNHFSSSASSRVSGGTQQAVFGSSLPLDPTSTNPFGFAVGKTPADYTSGNPFASPVRISFDDRGNANDADFQDFTVDAVVTAAQPVPEPATLVGLGLVGGALTLSRRRASVSKVS